MHVTCLISISHMEHSAGQHLLGEGDHVCLHVEVFVGPHAARAPGPGLHLVHHEGDVALLAHPRQPLEEVRAAVVVAALGLDGLRDDPRHGLAVNSLNRTQNFLHNKVTFFLYITKVVNLFSFGHKSETEETPLKYFKQGHSPLSR